MPQVDKMIIHAQQRWTRGQGICVINKDENVYCY